MLITINGVPGVGKTAACDWLTANRSRTHWIETDLRTLVRSLVARGFNPKDPEGFVDWQRQFIRAAIDTIAQIPRCDEDIWLLENGVEQTLGYSIAQCSLFDRDSDWEGAQRCLEMEAERLRGYLGRVSVVLTADIGVIRGRREGREEEPDYLDLRGREAQHQSTFVQTIQHFAPNVLTLETSSMTPAQVGSAIGSRISETLEGGQPS